MLQQMEQKQHAAAKATEQQVFMAVEQTMKRMHDQMERLGSRVDRLESAFGSAIEDLPDRLSAVERELEQKAEGTAAAAAHDSQEELFAERVAGLEQAGQHQNSRLGALEESLPVYRALSERLVKVEHAVQQQQQVAPEPLNQPEPHGHSSVLDQNHRSSLVEHTPPPPPPPLPESRQDSSVLEQRVERQLGQWEESIEKRLGRLGVHREEFSPRVPRVTHKYVPPTQQGSTSGYRTLAFSRNTGVTAESNPLQGSQQRPEGARSRVQSSPRVAGWCGEISAAIEQHCNELAKRVDDAISELQGADTKYQPHSKEAPASPLTVNDLSLHPNPSYTGTYTAGYASPGKASRIYPNQELSPFSAHVRTLLQQ